MEKAFKKFDYFFFNFGNFWVINALITALIAFKLNQGSLVKIENKVHFQKASSNFFLIS